MRFRDGHTEVYRDPLKVLCRDGVISLEFEKSTISLIRENILFIEDSKFEEVVKPKKEKQGE